MKSQFEENPTLATITRVQGVLERADGPITRYELHKQLKGRVNYPVLDTVLAYFTELRVIVDEGKGGKILWVHATDQKARDLFASSRRVA